MKNLLILSKKVILNRPWDLKSHAKQHILSPERVNIQTKPEQHIHIFQMYFTTFINDYHTSSNIKLHLFINN